MNKKEKEVQLKLQKSAAMMAEVEILLQNKFYNTSINRLYYSCFHLTTALLLLRNLTPKTHSGVAILLNKEFVQNKIFDVQQASFFYKVDE